MLQGTLHLEDRPDYGDFNISLIRPHVLWGDP